LHNFAKFDGIFLLKHLASFLSEGAFVDPIINDNKLIQVKTNFNQIVLNWRDSYLLLPSSLSKLCKAFNLDLEQSKTFFPVLFNPFLFKKKGDIDYKGSVPDFKFFTNLNQEEYEDYKNNYINLE
jgi:hypothetical protein